MTLLLVDDEPVVTDMMRGIVDYSKYGIDTVLSALSMKEAQKILESQEVDIVLCDIEMPGGSGLELIKWMNNRQMHAVQIILSAHSDFEFAQMAVDLHCFSYLLKPVTPETMNELLNRALKEVRNRQSDTRLRTLGQDYAKTISPAEENDAVENVRKYIDKHIQEELSVEKLAQMAYMSQNHLTRCFKKNYGKTVIEYIICHRLALAETLLRDTNKTVTQISDEVGYFDYVYFSKLFKKHFGMTPREFRMIMKNEKR